jgi:gliding motility-associated-like protein
MYKKIHHIILLLLMLICNAELLAQIAMPDRVCIGTTRTYKVNDPSVPSTYTWKIDGVLQSSIKNEMMVTWTTPGTYELSVQEYAANGCVGDIRTGTVYVFPLPVANAGADILMCFGAKQNLSASGGTSYQWSPGNYLSNTSIANPTLTAPPRPGIYKYTVQVTNENGCTSAKPDTIEVTVLPQPKVFAGRDTAVAINQQLQLNAIDASSSRFVNYSWTPPFGLSDSRLQNPVAIFGSVTDNNGIRYVVTATSPEGCRAQDDIVVKVFLQPEIYVPTGFTPNGDGLNDFAIAIPVGLKELKYFRIYNRWGELVFATNDASKGWNGRINGIEQTSAVFAWVAEGIDYQGKIIARKGTVTLIR